MHLLLRRPGSPELSLWLPHGHAPGRGEAFGLYLHADRHHRDRVGTAARFRRAIGLGPPIARQRHPRAHRLAAMLCLHDLALAGASLRDIAETLLDPLPDDWRSSDERSDLRRLAEAGAAMVAGGYRVLLQPRRPPDDRFA